MHRELELTLYNFTSNDLNLYEGYLYNYADKNDYLHVEAKSTRKTSYFDPSKSLCYIQFEHPTRVTHIGSYRSAFEWNTKFHEESHHVDRLLGGDKALTFPGTTKGSKQFVNSLRNDVLAFVSMAREDYRKSGGKGLSGNSAIKDFNDDCSGSQKAFVYYIHQHHPDLRTVATLTDIIHLCAHGKYDWFCTDRESEMYCMSELKKITFTRDIYLYMHRDDNGEVYNSRDIGHKAICDETSEGWAELNATRLTDDTTDESGQYLANSLKAFTDLLNVAYKKLEGHDARQVLKRTNPI